jgi:hypothetical protein
MDFHHDTSLRFILEDDFISSTSKACIHFCSGKGAGLWLVVKPSINLFHIAHFYFHFNVAFSSQFDSSFNIFFFMCECGQGLDTSNMHLTHCPFGGLQIATRDAIQVVMYALVRKSEHNVWKK